MKPGWKTCVLTLLAAMLTAPSAFASGDRIGLVVPRATDIPGGFRSWSLFLVCNPGWLIDNSRPELAKLNRAFHVFGEVIGPENVAIWFSRSDDPAASSENAAADYDVSRAAQYCTRLGLRPSESPFVIVTTTHPDAAGEHGNVYRLALGGADADTSIRLLTTLSDQVTSGQLKQEIIDTEQYWRSWEQVARRFAGAAGAVFSRVRITINTRFFKVEYAPR